MPNQTNHFIAERLIHFKKMLPLSMTFFIYLFAWGLVLPVFNIRINEVTNSLFLSGIIFSLFGFVRIFFDPSIGLLCDRINPKKILQASLLMYTLVFILYVFSNTFESLFITRFLHAIAGSMIWVSGWTIARRKSVGRHAQEEISSWVTIQDIAYVIAPIIGGVLITLTSWQPAYYLAAIISFTGFIYATIKIENTDITHDGIVRKFSQQWKNFFKNKNAAIRLSLLALVLFFVSTAFGNFLPLQLYNNKLTISEISIILGMSMTIPYIMFPIIIGILSDKYGRKIPTLIGLILAAIGIYMTGQSSTFTQYLFYTFTISTGLAFIDLSVNAELNDLTSKDEIGGFTGIFEMIKDIGMAAGPILAGLIASITTLNYAFNILAIISLASITILKGFKHY